MKLLPILVALAGCRQVLGIPSEGDLIGGVEKFDVTVMVRGVTGASKRVAINVMSSDGASNALEVTSDSMYRFPVPDGQSYTVSVPETCFVQNGTGTIDNGPPATEARVDCDGLASLKDVGFSAPVDITFAGGNGTYMPRASAIVQETTLVPVENYAGLMVTVDVDGAPRTPVNGVYGPFQFNNNSTIDINTRYDSFTRAYKLALDVATPAQFGYGKPQAATPGSLFGSAIASDKDLVAVGAPADHGNLGGRVYVFRRRGRAWSEEAILSAMGSRNGDRFGTSVAVRDGRILVGAPGGSLASPAAYLFTYAGTAWSTPSTLTESSAGDKTSYGTSVAMDVANLYVGAPLANSAAGIVYTYDASGTNGTPSLTGTDAGDRFGSSLAAANGLLVIGAPGEDSASSDPNDNSRPDAGAIYIHSGGTTTYVKPDKFDGDQFGTTVATNGTFVIVGVPLDSFLAPRSGAIVIFKLDQGIWTMVQIVRPAVAQISPNDHFGAAIAIAGNVLAVSAPFEDSSSVTLNESADDAGAVYVFPLDADGVDTTCGAGDPCTSYVKPGEPTANAAFGTALALTKECLVVGSPYERSGTTGWNSSPVYIGADSGAVFTFR